MKSRLAITIGVLVVAGLAGCVAWMAGVFEPHYNGLSASAYLQKLIEQPDRFGGEEDRKKILAVPPRVGVPILIRLTQAQDPRWRGWYQRLYPKLPPFITRRLGPPKSNDPMVQRAVMGLGYYGPEAAPAVPQLLKIESTAKALSLQMAAITTLGDIGPGASNAIPMLVTHFQSRPAFLFRDAAPALGKIDARGERCGALLVTALENGSERGYERGFMEASALEALGRMAANEPKWIQDIWRLMEDSLTTKSPLTFDFLSRGAACLQRLNALDAERVRVICGHSENSETLVRQSVAGALAYATGHAEMTTPVVLKLMVDANGNVRDAACSTLLRYAQSTNITVALRVRAVRAAVSCASDAGNKWYALAAAQRLGQAAAPALDAISMWLSHPDERIRGKAAEAMGALGPAGISAKPALEPLLKDRWGFVRDAAQTALSNITSGAASP